MKYKKWINFVRAELKDSFKVDKIDHGRNVDGEEFFVVAIPGDREGALLDKIFQMHHSGEFKKLEIDGYWCHIYIEILMEENSEEETEKELGASV